MPARLFHGVRGGASGSAFGGLAWLFRSEEGSTVRVRDGGGGNGDGGQNGGEGGGRHGGGKHDCNNNNRRDGNGGRGCGRKGGFGDGGGGGDGNSGDNGQGLEQASSDLPATSPTESSLSSPLASSTPPADGPERSSQPLVIQGVSPASTPLPSPTDLSTINPNVTDSTSPASRSVLPQNTLSHGKTNTVAIASGAVGGFFVLILIAGAIWLWMRRRKNRTAPSAEFLIYPPGVPFQRMGSSSSLSHNGDEPPPPFAPGLYSYPIREKEG